MKEGKEPFVTPSRMDKSRVAWTCRIIFGGCTVVTPMKWPKLGKKIAQTFFLEQRQSCHKQNLSQKSFRKKFCFTPQHHCYSAANSQSHHISISISQGGLKFQHATAATWLGDNLISVFKFSEGIYSVATDAMDATWQSHLTSICISQGGSLISACHSCHKT